MLCVTTQSVPLRVKDRQGIITHITFCHVLSRRMLCPADFTANSRSFLLRSIQAGLIKWFQFHALTSLDPVF